MSFVLVYLSMKIFNTQDFFGREIQEKTCIYNIDISLYYIRLIICPLPITLFLNVFFSKGMSLLSFRFILVRPLSPTSFSRDQ